MSIVCRRASESDRAELKALWCLAFAEDTEQDIDLFLNTFDVSQSGFVLCENDRVCSMLFLLPLTIEVSAVRYEAGYIYAGATHPAARGQGYYRRLLTFVAETAKQEGMAALVLRPATQELFESYRRMGFTDELIGNARVNADECDGVYTTLSPRDYVRRRCTIMRERGQAFVDWHERVIAYALNWCEARLIADGTLMLFDPESGYVGEQLPPLDGKTYMAALMKPLERMPTTPIWFGYGLE